MTMGAERKQKKKRDKNGHGDRRRQQESENSGREETTTAPPSFSHNSLLIQLTDDEPTWYQVAKNHPDRNATIDAAKKMRNKQQIVAKYRAMADDIYRRELYLFSKEDNQGDRWVESTARRGTLKDRVAAMSVVVSTHPVHKFYSLDGLLQMAGSTESGGGQQSNSRVAQLAAEALEDLFLNTFLPHDRKLMGLEERPLHLYEGNNISLRLLLLWRFEEMVKHKYGLFLQHFVTHTLRNGLDTEKVFCIRCIASLLRTVPEGEETNLQWIVNKLGDPSRRVAAASALELRRLLLQHQAMQMVVAREVQQLAHRPNLAARALYNCITFLNQLRLSHDEVDPTSQTPFAASLITTYFKLFEVAVSSGAEDDDKKKNKKSKKKKESNEPPGMQSRLLSALLTGVNRAHPYLPAKDKNMDEHIDALFRVVHKAQPAACRQALLLLFHVCVSSGNEEQVQKAARQDRFYRALYTVLSKPCMLESGSRLNMMYNLLYKAMKYDTDPNRVLAFAKRILSTTMHCPNAAVVAASIFLVNEISKTHAVLQECLTEPLESSSDAKRILDPTKREPRGALVVADEEEELSQHAAENDQQQLRKAGIWEVSLTQHHFHPTVAKFSAAAGSPQDDLDYGGDPLADFSLARFLDKFAYRNPKSAARVANKFGGRRNVPEATLQAHFAPPVNDPTFTQQHVDSIAEHDQFYYKFFTERERRDEIKGITREKQKEEEEEEKVIDKAAEPQVDRDPSFDQYSSRWESDSEEEAFVDSLAEQIVEDSAGGGPTAAELDNEDPDMGGWNDDDDDDESSSSDSSDDDDKGMNNREKEKSKKDAEDTAAEAAMKDQDAFMDVDDSSDDDDGVNQELDDEVEALRPLGRGSDDEDEDETPFGEDEDGDAKSAGGRLSSAADGADDDDLAFVDDLDDDDNASSEEEDKASKKRKKKKKKFTETFVDADEFYEQMNASQKRPADEDKRRKDNSRKKTRKSSYE